MAYLYLSPSQGEAILMGNQHYKTFDGTYYAYAGKCSFLLAQDFVDNNFTIAVEYERKDSQSGKFFTIIAGEETFEIRDGRVMLSLKFFLLMALNSVDTQQGIVLNDF